MAAGPFILDEDEAPSAAETRYDWACSVLDGALLAETRQGRYAGLLATFLICEQQDREVLFVETARRLSRCEEAVTDPSIPAACARVDVLQPQPARQLWERLRGALAALRARPLQPQSGS